MKRTVCRKTGTVPIFGKQGLSLFLWVAAVAPAAAQVVNEPTLSTDAALNIASAALAQCRQDGQKVTVSVVDHAGREKIRVRERRRGAAHRGACLPQGLHRAHVQDALR